MSRGSTMSARIDIVVGVCAVHCSGHSSDFIGGDSFFLMREYISPCKYADWFFQVCAVAS
jgi:hypothetical protein